MNQNSFEFKCIESHHHHHLLKITKNRKKNLFLFSVDIVDDVHVVASEYI